MPLPSLSFFLLAVLGLLEGRTCWAAPTLSPPAAAGILEWTDANWKDDGSAQIPLGNGDVTAGVWVSNTTGDLRILVTRSSAFDENSQPVKIGALRLKLNPPLSLTTTAGFQQQFDPSTATFRIQDEFYRLAMFVDAHAPVLRVSVTNDHRPFSASASLEPYRVFQRSPIEPHSDCHADKRLDHYDTIVNTTSSPSLNSTVTWYHQNPDNASTAYFNSTLEGQGLDPNDFPNPYFRRIFGGSLHSNQLQPVDELTIAGSKLNTADIQIAVLTKRPSTADAWLESMADVVKASNTTAKQARQKHKNTWQQLWNRSYVQLSSRSADQNPEATKLVNAHLVWDRYLTLIQGRTAQSPIKFNGQAFTANGTGRGWDFRGWGSGYWWQNTRQPYYNSLPQGDVEVLDSMISFYHQMLPMVRARTYQQFRDTDLPLPPDAVFYPETTTMFGTYYMAEWGCKGNSSRPHGASQSPWIRFHWTGGLELSLLILDRYQYTGDAKVLRQQLEIVLGVVSAFVNRWPIHNKDGKIDIFPAQSLETWQCHNPANRSDCVTNPTPEIAGLQTILRRLIHLPPSLVSEPQRQFWANYSKALPKLPTTTIGNDTVIAPGEGLPPKPTNSENCELYTVHPYRIFGVGKPNLSLAQATYNHRRFPCNNGWCQDVVDAAMLNLTNETVKLVQDRARKGSDKGFRFPGFAAHMQDFEPSLDHFATLTTAVNSMLLSSLDETGNMIAFPGFPADVWDVEFKLHGPNNTVIEGSCQDGKVVSLRVDPPEKQSLVQHTGNCRMVPTLAVE